MSLLSTFPEIDNFFNKNQFSDIELSDFLTDIEKKYQNVVLRKAALSLINLEILKYNIQKKPVKVCALKKEKIRTKITIAKPNYNSDLNILKTLTIQKIAHNLDWSTHKLQVLLKQKKIEKIESEILSESEFLKVKEMLLARLTAIKRIENKKILENTPHIKNKKNNNSLNKGNDVYSQIYKIGLGKVIYIRKQ